AVMKAETKSKRRVTLSICGLGILDETEIETIPESKPAPKLVTAPYELPQKEIPGVDILNDETFEIGTDIKGKKFSEKVNDPGFTKWVNDALEKNYSKTH